MQVNIFPKRYPPPAGDWSLLLKEGVERGGDSACIANLVDGDGVHAFWGQRRARGALARHKKVLIVERAYLGDRFHWYSLGLNGLNGFANFGNQDVLDDRWRKYWRDSVRDWKTGGDYALLIGQVPGDASLQGLNIFDWLNKTAASAKKQFGEVVYRPHPMCRQRMGVRGCKTLRGSLADALSGAKVVITYSSNVAVDAVMAGVPAIAFSKGSMAWDVTTHNMEEPLYTGDRDEWGRKIAYAQWLPEEIQSGEAWAHIREHV